MTRRILLIDPLSQGHHSAYLQWLLAGAVERGHPVHVIGAEDLPRRPHFSEPSNQALLAPRFEPFPARRWPGASSDDVSTPILVANQIAEWHSLHYTARRLSGQFDLVVLPYIDSVMYAIAVLGNPFGHIPLRGISMRPPNFSEQRVLPRLKQWLYRRALSLESVERVYLIDELSLAGLTAFSDSKKLVYLPDPVVRTGSHERETARARFELPASSVIVMVYGSISHRKGLSLLLDAFSDSRIPPALHVFIAGEQTMEIQVALQDFRDTYPERFRNITCIARPLSLDEEAAAFASADISWLAYENHPGMSGVLVRSAIEGLACIVSDYGLMGWYANQGGVGIAVPRKDREAAVNALIALCTNEDLRRQLGANGRRRFESNTVEAFQRVVFGN